jgi:hypothetical protein
MQECRRLYASRGDAASILSRTTPASAGGYILSLTKYLE